MGSLFDSQPSQLKGNIFNVTNPDEMVIGFVSAGTITEKRIYINNFEIPSFKLNTNNSNCEIFQFDGANFSFFDSGI